MSLVICRWLIVPRIAFSLEYHGKRFHGSQLQVGVRTVQLELENAFGILAKQPIRVHLSGRTDAGVHAAGQCFHIDWPDGVAPANSVSAAASKQADDARVANLDVAKTARDEGSRTANDVKSAGDAGSRTANDVKTARAASSAKATSAKAADEAGSTNERPTKSAGVVRAADVVVGAGGEGLDLWRLARALNGIMKDDIAVVGAQIVDDNFHARYSATQRQYVYRILNRPQRSALLKDTHYHMPYALDVKAMQDGALRLLGKHDFAAFRSSNSEQVNTICTVSRSEILQLDDGRLEFWIAADRFVYNMVRIIAGTLTEIGLGKRTLESLEAALEQGDRDLSGPTAPPWGLTLHSVRYPQNYKLFERDTFHEKA